jgi:hypothetical protein
MPSFWLNVDDPLRTQVLHVENGCWDVQRRGTGQYKPVGRIARDGGWLSFESIALAEESSTSRSAFKPLAFCSNCQRLHPEFSAAARLGPTDLGTTETPALSASLAEKLADLQPRTAGIVYELVRAAGIDVADWSIDKGGNDIDPATNTYRNSQWSYGGGDEPTALCVWWRDLTVVDGLIVFDGNSKEFHTTLGNELAAPGRTQSEAQRLRGKINKSRTFEAKVAEAYRKRKPVRLILLEGDAAGSDVAAVTSSRTEARSLDSSSWYVHRYDPLLGSYRIVRDLPLAAPLTPDPFDGAVDPGEDAEFTQFLEDAPLSETEKNALVKLRVGQGYFRQHLIKRWGGCSVTGCADESVLIASHIVPWSKCTTRTERLSVANGLLLTPNLDKLFDRGLISFDDRGKIMLSVNLPLGTAISLHVDPGLQLKRRGFDDFQPYLERHRNEIFQAPAKR